MRPSAAPLRSLRLSRPSTSSAVVRHFAVSRPTTAATTSSSSTPASTQPYTAPIEPGVLPAYDLCLQYLRDTAESKRSLIPALEKEIEHLSAQASSEELSPDDRAECRKQLQRLRKRVWTFKGGADRFDPQVRYEFKAGLAHPSTDSFRYLDQERFELEGALDQHVQNLNIMHVVPDVCNVGRKGLTVDLVLRFPAPPPKPAPVPDEFGWIKSKSDRVVAVRDQKDGDRVIVGSKLTVGEVRPQPEVEIRYFGTEARYGTLVMVDPDVPSPATHSFTERIHWLVPNIPLSSSARIFPSPDFAASSAQHNVALPESAIPYLPPHPHKGSPSYHRYVFALITHPEEVDVAQLREAGQGEGASLRKVQEAISRQGQADITGKADIAGLTFFRADYDPVECPKIWEEVIKEPELKFVTPISKSAWVVDPHAVPLNASFRRPSPLEKSASLKKRNKALLYNQQLGIVSKGVDKETRFVTSAEWEKRSAASAGKRSAEEEQAELRQLFGDRVTPEGQPVFDTPQPQQQQLEAAETPAAQEPTTTESKP